MSRNRTKMNYSGGTFPGSGKCVCEMNDTCDNSDKPCNCSANIDGNELEDSRQRLVDRQVGSSCESAEIR